MLFAYIDPGLGALLWQTIIAAFVGFLFYLKRTRRWIVGMFRKIFRRGGKKQGVGSEIPPPKEEAKTDAK
jgi:O-antigen/teichoic acid export membrane protein